MVHSTNRSGFSLIEILIAVAIVGLMAVVVGPAMWNLLGFGRRGQTKASMQGIKTSILHYHLDTNAYPEKLDDLIQRPEEERIANKWYGPYLEAEEVPRDGWDNPFIYRRAPGKRPPYELYSYGPEGPDAPEEQWIRVGR